MHTEFRPPQNQSTEHLTVEIKNQHTQEKKRLQTTSNSTHSPNIFISNGNTPHICSQTHISACVCISVHYKVSQTAQLTAGVKNLTHTHKKRLQTTSNSTHSPHMHISIKITSLTCSRTHINACKCISVRHKSACQHPQRSLKTLLRLMPKYWNFELAITRTKFSLLPPLLFFFPLKGQLLVR